MTMLFLYSEYDYLPTKALFVTTLVDIFYGFFKNMLKFINEVVSETMVARYMCYQD